MIFEDRIQANPRLFRLKDPRTNEIVDFEMQDLLPEEIVQEGTEIDAAYLNGLLTYSMEEKQVGYWIDGKPLYMKTIDFGALPNNSSKSMTHNMQNLKRIWKLGGFAGSSINKGGIPLPYAVSSPVALYASDTDITVLTTNDRTAYTQTYIYIWYTKTTD
jgi:hypothetical protein